MRFGGTVVGKEKNPYDNGRKRDKRVPLPGAVQPGQKNVTSRKREKGGRARPGMLPGNYYCRKQNQGRQQMHQKRRHCPPPAAALKDIKREQGQKQNKQYPRCPGQPKYFWLFRHKYYVILIYA